MASITQASTRRPSASHAVAGRGGARAPSSVGAAATGGTVTGPGSNSLNVMGGLRLVAARVGARLPVRRGRSGQGGAEPPGAEAGKGQPVSDGRGAKARPSGGGPGGGAA